MIFGHLSSRLLFVWNVLRAGNSFIIDSTRHVQRMTFVSCLVAHIPASRSVPSRDKTGDDNAEDGVPTFKVEGIEFDSGLERIKITTNAICATQMVERIGTSAHMWLSCKLPRPSHPQHQQDFARTGVY